MDGLAMCLDAKNTKKSAKGNSNLLNLSTWTLGTGSVSGFSMNGTTAENQRILDTGPFGVSALVWDTPSNDATSDADGGWNSTYVNIDPTKTYRWSVWSRRKTVGNGSFYLGNYGFNASYVNEGVLNRSTGAVDTNPYFHATAWPASAGQWVLLVGHMWPAGSGTGSFHPDSGVWNTSGTKLSGSNNEYVWQATNVKTTHRSYLYYSTDTTTNQQWYQPRIDLVDGTEPSVAELIAGVGSKWYDTFSTNHLDILNSAALYDTAEYMNFDGVDDVAATTDTPTYGNNMTWEAWVYCTQNVSTFNMFMGRLLPYFSFYTGNTILFSNDIGGTQRSIYTASNISLNTWYHIVGTTSYDGANTTMKTYVNGVEAATGTYAGAQVNASYAGYKFCVGDGRNTVWYPFKGRVSAVKVYSRTLSPVEIQQNFNALRGRFGI